MFATWIMNSDWSISCSIEISKVYNIRLQKYAVGTKKFLKKTRKSAFVWVFFRKGRLSNCLWSIASVWRKTYFILELSFFLKGRKNLSLFSGHPVSIRN